MASEMEEALSKIRPHTSSNLPHQKAPANLLVALEKTFKEQNAERTPAAYFAGVLTALEATVQKEKESKFALGDGDILPAELYLLAMVGPYVPQPIIRANLNTLLASTAGLWQDLLLHPPPLRSQITLYNAALRASDRAQLESSGLRQSFATILQLCVDARPKVRKKAAEVVRDLLANPPSPLVQHPYATRVGEWAAKSLSEVTAVGSSKTKKKGAEDASATAIHLLAFLRPILPYLPSSSLPSITTSLLALPRIGNAYLSQSAYSVLSSLLTLPASDDEAVPRNVDSSAAELLQAVMSSPPSKSESNLFALWTQVLGNIMRLYAASDSKACDAELGKVWKTVFPYLETSDAGTRVDVAGTLTTLSQCISDDLIKSAISAADTSKSVVGQMIEQLSKALDSIAYASAIPQVLIVTSAVITRLRYRPDGRAGKTAAEQLILPLVSKLGDLRMKKGFEQKEALDEVLRTATSTLGPEILLEVMPLNLEPKDRVAGQQARAFLLPLLTTPHPSPLGHFISYFVPLTERMFEQQQTASSEGRDSEAKVWSVLISQIWSGLPAYCDSAPDLCEALTPQFSQLLSQLLYNQPELRPPVLRALKVVVESNAKESQNDPALRPSAEEIQKNRTFLQTQAESWFAVLFNVFGSVGRENQGMVGDVISSWASIADREQMTKTCQKVVGLFKTNLAASAKTTSIQKGAEQTQNVVATMQDILLLLIPYVSADDARAVLDLCSAPEVLTHKDNAVQKRAYKILSKIMNKSRDEDGFVEVDVEALYKRLDELAEDTSAAAKKDRLILLKVLLEYLPSTSLHVIPSLIPEAVLGTKEPSEKARDVAYDLVVAMAYKMQAGGVVKRSKLDGMDEDMGESHATIEEFLTMLAGGLAGATPHMISATTTAITRLVFEFKDSISETMHTEILSTFLVFLTSANREIVKSTLGFVKLAIHSLPLSILRPQLPQIVKGLLTWSHDHKNHFKEKVRHIFERLLRRFPFDEVYACVGENEEGGKLLVNIKKRKERSRRKKAQRGDEDEEEEEKVTRAKPLTGDAFEDVLYGSESDLDESDEEHKAQPKAVTDKKKQKKDFGARLRIDDDEPLDLLQGAGNIVTSSRHSRRKPGQDAEKMKVDAESGKMLIESDSDSDQAEAEEDVEGTAYRETLTSADGFTRGRNGRVKFNKDTKKRRRENEELDGDVEMADATADKSAVKKLKRKKSVVKIGQEFKAKNAGGDVKKGGVDPYAYLTLSQAAKGGKGKGKQKFTVTGKR